MPASLARFEFAQPLYLWLLPLVVLLWLTHRHQPWSLIAWRSLIFFLLVLALADPREVSEYARSQVIGRIFAFDLSESMSPEMRRRMGELAQARLSPGGNDRVFVFGGSTREVEEWEAWLGGKVPTGPIAPEATNLEALFSEILGLGVRSQRLFLFTDGWENQGQGERLLPALSRAAIQVFPFLPDSRPPVSNVAVKKVVAPGYGMSGESVALKVLIENANEGEVTGTLVLKRDGEPLQSTTVALKPGSQILSYKLPLPRLPLTVFQAVFVPADGSRDRNAKDNQAAAWVAVSFKEKVLLLSGERNQGKYLEEILQRRGFEVTSATPAAPPEPEEFGLVIFNNVAREELPGGYMARVEQRVATGGGFIMLGGENSLGPGGYRGTPIEKLLPVELKEPVKEERNRAIILVIDKSGSMREEGKLLYAKEAAKALVNSLKDQDLFGVVGFDSAPFVVLPLGRVEKARGEVTGQIDRLVAGGQTYLYPALMEAKRQLERQQATRKHVIVLSDGETGGTGSDYIDLVGVMKEELKITVSAVAIGDQANLPLLSRIARYGGGLFHHTYDPQSLPRIVLDQAQEKPQDGPMVERELAPEVGPGSALLAGFRQPVPPVKGYIETELKKGASLDLFVKKTERASPLLASWPYAKGKAIVLTTDLYGRWSQEWIRWRGLEDFWARILDWLSPPKEPFPAHEVRLNVQEGQPLLELYVYGEESRGSLFRFSVRGRESSEGTLEQVVAGRYQAKLPVSQPGDYRIEIREERGDKVLAYPTVGYTLPFDLRQEHLSTDWNVALLDKLAAATGGEVNPREIRADKAVEVESGRASRPLRVPLVLVAACLFVAEILCRRFLLREEV